MPKRTRPKYTTGEVAKLCGVTVRTVQYYDTCGILVPSKLTDGGRRLYTKDDMNRMKIICFLRELGLSIDAISQIFSEDDMGDLISLLLRQQQALSKKIEEYQKKLNRLEMLHYGLENVEAVSVESIADVVHTMSGKNKLKRVRVAMLVTALPIGVIQLISIILWITKGLWWLFAVWIAVAIPYAIFIAKYYFKNVAYICPQCHVVFKPMLKDALWARHTPAARKLTCTSCGRHGFCVEVAAEVGGKG